MVLRMSSQAPTPINLARGWPNPGLLPVEKWEEATAVALSNPEINTPDSSLEYGPDDGYTPLRHEIANWLTSFYKPLHPITAERICITGGASQNLACILQTFTDPVYTRNIWMVAPTYFCACRVFDDSGFAGRLRAVPEDDEGIDIKYLTQQMRLSEERAIATKNLHPELKPPRAWRKIYRHVIYAVPTFANPSGRVMSLARREAVVRIARKYDALIITDDVYDMLQWSSSPNVEPQYPENACLPRIADIDRYLDGGPADEYGHAVSNGSFSKLVGPGCRTGWAEGTSKFVFGLSQTGTSRSGGCASQLTASFLHQLLITSLPQYIRTVLQPAYARRYHTLMSTIEEALLPLGVTMSPPNPNDIVGGYFVWLTLPAGTSAEVVAKRALEEEALIVPPGSTFQVYGDAVSGTDGFENNLRLCFAWVEEQLLVDGVRRLAAVVERILAHSMEDKT